MTNYDDLSVVTTVAAKISNALRTNRNQARTECNNYGLKLTRISKDNMTLYAHFMLKNKMCKLQIQNEEVGTMLTCKIP